MDIFALNRLHRKRLLVIGDALLDVWLHGRLESCQDGCPKFVIHQRENTPGGAANAAHSLVHWNVDIGLAAPVEYGRFSAWQHRYRWQNLQRIEVIDSYFMPVKTRCIDDTTGKIVFRLDEEADSDYLSAHRDRALEALKQLWDAVYVADYAKGFLDHSTIDAIVHECVQRDLPVVVDPKRSPTCCRDAVLKCNLDYATHYFKDVASHVPSVVITCGNQAPIVTGEVEADLELPHLPPPALCVNHVGAGDCFGAHLALALAHGLPIEDAARLAHTAAGVYVQHPHSRPPWPHEVARQLDPAGGKVIHASDLPALRGSDSGRIVFTNGVFRLGVHAGHAWLFDWARQHGDMLVVGVNDDASAAALRNGQHVLPLAARLQALASQQAVDWIIPFPEEDPRVTMMALKPDLLVKGYEYHDQAVPGSELAKTVFAPPGPFSEHAADLEALLREVR